MKLYLFKMMSQSIYVQEDKGFNNYILKVRILKCFVLTFL